MANHVSALKRVRITERRTEVNSQRISRMRTAIKKFRKLISEKNIAEATSVLSATFSQIDRAAKTGVIKKNTASRYKSRLAANLKRVAA